MPLTPNQAPSSTTWINSGYWIATYGNPYNGTAQPEDMTFKMIGHSTKNASSNEDCYMTVVGHVSTDSFGIDVKSYYIGGGSISPIQIYVYKVAPQGLNQNIFY
jgi:hypothetical protein